MQLLKLPIQFAACTMLQHVSLNTLWPSCCHAMPCCFVYVVFSTTKHAHTGAQVPQHHDQFTAAGAERDSSRHQQLSATHRSCVNLWSSAASHSSGVW